MARSSRRASTPSTARGSASSTSPTRHRPAPSRQRSPARVFSVASVESRPAKRHPAAPFTTSTLQQEASRKLGFAAARTMQVAQRLYEGVEIDGEVTGLITYMRTDGVQMAPEAIAATRNVIQRRFGEPYVPGVPRQYRAKAKNAQEAHEAIRPTDLFRHPDQARRVLDRDQAELYELIWKRTVASQMESADIERTTVDIVASGRDGKSYVFRATGSVVRFDGFLKLYQEGRDDEEDEDSRRLPQVARGDRLGVAALAGEQHFTEPPPRYSEASLIKKMEELGIGRPSTYTAILTVLRSAAMSARRARSSFPRTRAGWSPPSSKSFFSRYVEYGFTANLEEQLDRISSGEIDWKEVLRDFWRDFTVALGGHPGPAHRRSPGSPQQPAGAAYLPGRRGRRAGAHLPDLQGRRPVAQAWQVRRLHRLLELSRMPLHPPARVIRRRRGQELDSGRRQAARR